jgi:hypothetical protein
MVKERAFHWISFELMMRNLREFTSDGFKIFSSKLKKRIPTILESIVSWKEG